MRKLFVFIVFFIINLSDAKVKFILQTTLLNIREDHIIMMLVVGECSDLPDLPQVIPRHQ